MLEKSDIARRIAERHIRRRGDAASDPKNLLHNYEESLRSWTLDAHQLAHAQQQLEQIVQHGIAGRADEYGRAEEVASKAYEHLGSRSRLWNIGGAMFRAILQNHVLAPALRKKIEAAARMYYGQSKLTFRGSGVKVALAYIETYLKFLKTFTAHAQLAHQALAQAQTHVEHGEAATRVRVGPFTLVNAGGFPVEVVKTAAALLHKAVELTHRGKVGEVCYGDVPITNKIGSTKHAAFYAVGSDELFVRGDLRQNLDTEETLLHELGHRYEHRFLKGGHRTAEGIYLGIKDHEGDRKRDLTMSIPKVGDPMTVRGQKFTVNSIKAVPGGNYRIILQAENGLTYSVLWTPPGTSKRDVADPKFRGFVTNYAKTSPAENFAEMFAHYCMGKLPGSQLDLFKNALFG